ncbi:mechanosensitive ion channel family protein [Bacillota bacterium LX-D]|nr:mechanosensitive ion channel family protein [Bacillota bacterium LX-D]
MPVMQSLFSYQVGLNLLEAVGIIVLIRLGIQVVNLIVGHFFKIYRAQNTTADETLVSNLENTIKKFLIYSGYIVGGIIGLELLNIGFVEAEDLEQYSFKILRVILILVASRLILKLGWAVVDHLFLEQENGTVFSLHRRAGTLRALLRSILKYTIYFIAAMMILEVFNVKTGSILAGAGIVGLAVGFGAQSLVKDVITGFFIIFEDQFTVGEYITTAGVTGTVEELGLRTTKIREWTGQLHIIPNGEITKVTNFNRGQMLAVVNLGISYEVDLDYALEVLRQACQEAAEEIPSLIEVPVVQGVTELRDFDVVIRVTARTLAGEQWEAERVLRKKLKQALDAHGIEIPYPKRVIITNPANENLNQTQQSEELRG